MRQDLYRCLTTVSHINVRVDEAAAIKAPFAAPSKLRNTLPPLASNDLFGCGSVGRARSWQERLFQCVEFAFWVKQSLYSIVDHPPGSGVDWNGSPRRRGKV